MQLCTIVYNIYDTSVTRDLYQSTFAAFILVCLYGILFWSLYVIGSNSVTIPDGGNNSTRYDLQGEVHYEKTIKQDVPTLHKKSYIEYKKPNTGVGKTKPTPTTRMTRVICNVL